jgi:hypothetical protein
MGSNIENTRGWFWDWKKKIDSMIGHNNPYHLFMTNSEDTNGSTFLREFFTNMYYEYHNSKGKNHHNYIKKNKIPVILALEFQYQLYLAMIIKLMGADH